MHRPPTGAAGRLQHNLRSYERVVDVARHRAARGDLEGVLRAAVLAGSYAWQTPTGLLNDPTLERLVVATVRAGGGTAEVDGTRDRGRVLHVLSEAYAYGGHTRLVWRWITRDPRAGDVALTNQLGPVPRELSAAVERSGGRLWDLRASAGDLASRAVALRDRMQHADVVVAHLHPYDAVALAAAAMPGPRPPVVYENHADHTYWLGLATADLVCDFRAAGQRVSTQRRGIADDRTVLLPLPVDAPAAVSGDGVRRALRLRPEDVLGLVVADPGKVAPLWGRGMADLLGPVLAGHPRLKVALVGVPAHGTWQALAERFPGRVFPVGRVDDPAPWYAAADVYLNSYPVVAGTSVLEAAAAGLPVLTLRDLDDREGLAAVYQGESPGLTDVQHLVTTDDQYSARLRRLIRDAAARHASGAAARDAVLAAHAGAGWTEALERLYARARSVSAADVDEYERVLHPAYGAMLLPLIAPVDRTPDVGEAVAPLADQMDVSLGLDLFAANNRDRGESLHVRVTSGWEDRPAGTRRLLGLARNHPRLSVSLPFVADDDAAATRSIAVLTEVLALDGATTEDCGDLNLDAEAPTTTGPALAGELALTGEELDAVEGLLASPCWDRPPSASGSPPARLQPIG